jgi:hypothetical protein
MHAQPGEFTEIRIVLPVLPHTFRGNGTDVYLYAALCCCALGLIVAHR